MKSSEEMVRSLFERRAQYDARQKQKKKIFIRVAAALGCVCLIAFAGFAVRNSIISDTAQQGSTADNKIVIGHTDGIMIDSSRKLDFELKPEDFVEMDKASLTEYYETELFPQVPKDLEEWNDIQGVYRENNGAGNVYYDGIILNYSNEDFSRCVNLEIEKGRLPVSCYAFFDEMEEMSDINGTEVKIAEADGYYYAQFMYRGAGFRIIGEGLTESEFVDIIASLIR